MSYVSPLDVGKIKVRVTVLVVGMTPSLTSCSIIPPTRPGPLKVTGTLVKVDKDTGDVLKPLATVVKDFNLVLKTDVQGSIEPLVQSLEELSVEEVNVKVIHASVGSVTESDVQLAVASAGVIIAFNVQTEPGAERLAKQEQVEIREYQIIYSILEDVEKAVKGMLAPIYREVQDATIEVRQVFRAVITGRTPPPPTPFAGRSASSPTTFSRRSRALPASLPTNPAAPISAAC